MSKKTLRWLLAALVLAGLTFSVIVYWPDARAIGVAVMAVMLAMMMGLYSIEKFQPSKRQP